MGAQDIDTTDAIVAPGPNCKSCISPKLAEPTCKALDALYSCYQCAWLAVHVTYSCRRQYPTTISQQVYCIVEKMNEVCPDQQNCTCSILCHISYPSYKATCEYLQSNDLCGKNSLAGGSPSAPMAKSG